MQISVFTAQRFASLHTGFCIAASRVAADMLSEVSFYCGACGVVVLRLVQCKRDYAFKLFA